MVRQQSFFSAQNEEIHRQPRRQIEPEEENSRPLAFSKRVYKEASKELFMLLPGFKKRGKRYHINECQINLATLQRMNIYAIRRDLVDLVGDIVKNEEMSMNFGRGNQAHQNRKLMSEYCNAWRDWQMMLDHASTIEDDPFRISCHDELSRELLKDAGLLDVKRVERAVDFQEPGAAFKIDLEKCETKELPGEARHARSKQEYVNRVTLRFLWSVAASLFLVVPVLIMVLNEASNLEALIITAVSIVVFAFVVALWLDEITLTDALAATLSYAAVLVVFTSLRVVPV